MRDRNPFQAAPSFARAATMLALAQVMLVACGSPAQSGDSEPLSSWTPAPAAGTLPLGTPVDPATLTIRATHRVRVHERASVTGDVGVAWAYPSWGLYALRLDERARVSGRVIASSVLLSPRAVTGDVFADRLNDRGAKHGDVSPFVPVPPPEPLAALMAATAALPVGTAPVTVAHDTTLAAGEYGGVTVESGAVLRLAGGYYVFAALDVAPGASVLALSTSRVRVATRLTSGSSSFVAVAEGVGTAKDLLIEVAGVDASEPQGEDAEGIGGAAVSIGSLSTVRALVSAPLGRIVVGAKASVTGALAASSIVLRSGASLTFEDGFDLEPGCPGGCDDGNRCTADTCVAGACRHEPVAAGTSCSDGSVCNGEEACGSDGACLPGVPLAVDDDANPCTADRCDPVAGVVHAPLPWATACDDSTVCNGRETCDGVGTCHQGTAPAVDDGNPCTADACDAVAGVTHTPVAAGTSCDDLTVCNGRESCDGAGICRAGVALVVDDGDACTADACDPASGGVTHLPIPGCQPPSFADSVAHLYSGPNPSQTGVQPGAIDPARVSVVRGAVVGIDGNVVPVSSVPLAGVAVGVFDHAELGRTLTRSDGTFELAVNGGQTLVVEYAKDGYPMVHRTMNVPTNVYVAAPEVALVAYDLAHTAIRSGVASVQVARGTPVGAGAELRRATLVFPPYTMPAMTFPDGTWDPLTLGTVRATELTIEPDPARAMPASLPPGAGTPYVVELSVDEAIIRGVEEVGFNPPPALYVENYHGYAVGTLLPVTSYYRDIAEWLEQPGVGRVVRILDVAGGVATLDTDNDGIADDPFRLYSLEIYDDELASLATLYAAGQTLVRVPVPRFGPLSCGP